MWKNIVERGRPQMTIWCIAMHSGYLRLQIHTQVASYCSCTATMVAQMRLNVTLYIHCLYFKILFKEGFLAWAIPWFGWLDACLGS